MAGPTEYVNRSSGEIEREREGTSDTLDWLYGTRSGRLLTHLLRRRWWSRCLGWVERGRWSRRLVPRLVAAYGIDLTDAERSIEEYTSLDDLFTRHLRAGARPVERDPDRLVAPADGYILVYPAVPRDGVLVKGGRFTLTEILRDEVSAARYLGGALAVVRLAPPDYHRFHFPAAGTPALPRLIGGRLDSVHPAALAAGARSLCENYRAVTCHLSERFGELLLIEVGALNVGTIEQTHRAGSPVRAGAEKGTFHMGGSTVIVCAERDRLTWDADLVAASARGLETRVRMGEPIGTCR